MFKIRRTSRGLLVAVMAAAMFGMAVGPSSAQTAGGPGSSTQEVVVQGIFGAVHNDPGDGRSRPYLDTFVSNERDPSQSTAVTFPRALADRYGGVEGLTSKRVAVRAVAPTRNRERGNLTAVAIDVQGDASKGLPFGNPGEPATPKPALTVLCRFKDKPAQPQMQPFFQGLAGDNSVMDNYFRTTSYHQINLFGSKVAPATGNWYVLPSNEADYLTEEKKLMKEKLYNDCSALASADLNLDDFAVINLAMNTDVQGKWAFGGSMDGRRLTWLTPWGWSQATAVAHEMGHAFYMDHVGLVGSYDNAWDVLSGWDLACTPIPTYQCMPPHQSAYNKNEAGWLDGRIVNVPEQASTTVELAPLDSSTGNVLARMAPTDAVAKHRYLVEFRRPVGLDANLPFAGAPGAVIIYEQWEVPNPTEEDPNGVSKKIKLMGFDGGAGARWLPGMVFDRQSMFTGNFCDNNDKCTKSALPEAEDWEIDGIRIRVDSITSDKATVTFTQLPKVTTLQVGPTTTSSYQLHWVDNATTESSFKITYSNNKTSGEVIVPANTTSYTVQNAPAGIEFTNRVYACNSLGCGPTGNAVQAGADPLPLKNK